MELTKEREKKLIKKGKDEKERDKRERMRKVKIDRLNEQL